MPDETKVPEATTHYEVNRDQLGHGPSGKFFGRGQVVARENLGRDDDEMARLLEIDALVPTTKAPTVTEPTIEPAPSVVKPTLDEVKQMQAEAAAKKAEKKK